MQPETAMSRQDIRQRRYVCGKCQTHYRRSGRCEQCVDETLLDLASATDRQLLWQMQNGQDADPMKRVARTGAQILLLCSAICLPLLFNPVMDVPPIKRIDAAQWMKGLVWAPVFFLGFGLVLYVLWYRARLGEQRMVRLPHGLTVDEVLMLDQIALEEGLDRG